jgi:hypothetical protein
MPLIVNIQSVTGNTPVDIYVCNSGGGSCTYVATVAVFPYQFEVDDTYATTDFIVKIIDTAGCEDQVPILVTPTPTPSITASATATPTITPTNTNTPTPTITQTRTPAASLTPTQTRTPTPTPTSLVYAHRIGRFLYTSSSSACLDTLLSTSYYTSYAETPTIPVVGARVYQNTFGGSLFSPVNQGNQWRLMVFNGANYAVQIDTSGYIINFVAC